MKKSLCVIITIALFLCSCNTVLPDERSKEESDIEEASQAESTEISEEISTEYSSAEESKAPAEEPSTEIPEESSTEISEESEEPEESSAEEEASEISEEESKAVSENILGNLTKPYFEILQSGKYMCRTSETKKIGGESLPYTISAYHNGDISYIIIKESYGSESVYLRKDGKITILDDFNKTALVYADDGEAYEKTLWQGFVTLKDEGTTELFDIDYDYETYTDETGFEFTLLFNNGTLERYRSYDKSVRDTIVISLLISDNISEGIFEIPEGYKIIEG